MTPTGRREHPQAPPLHRAAVSLKLPPCGSVHRRPVHLTAPPFQLPATQRLSILSKGPGWCSAARHACVSVPVPPRFLDFCRDHGGYTGCPFPDKVDPQHEQDLLKGLSKLSISTSGMAGPGQAGSWLALVGVEVRKTARLLSLQGPKVTTASPRIWRVKPTCPCKWSPSGEMSTEETQPAFSLCIPTRP